MDVATLLVPVRCRRRRWSEGIVPSRRVRLSGVQFARFPDTRERIAHPTPEPLVRAIFQTDVPSDNRNKAPGG
jgi:hypothetical protein